MKAFTATRCSLALPTALALVLSASPGLADNSEPISPIPILPKQDPAKVDLGRALFNDLRLSKGNTMACANCHKLSSGGADGLARSVSAAGRKLRNAPTIFNVELNFRMGWDGRSETLFQQTGAVLHDAGVMASSWGEVRTKLQQDAAMPQRFKAVYVDGLQEANIADALVAYQRSLTTPNSRFDRYLRGDRTAVSADELKGYALFKSNGCVACHQGVAIGGNMFQVFGVIGERGAYLSKRGDTEPLDFGRFNRTNLDADRFVFRVPSLRNVALTAPYLHDGSAATLEEAVDVMFKYQLGRTAQQAEKALIVKFLRTLTGELDGRPLDPADRPADPNGLTAHQERKP